ncbi:hypothetical protein [Kitasatospora camelliae]|uniref:Uncharacterized protein n=1 Tax=Kitasatospora camelliae TaxID=3156397 RepID=A0AAU8K112_9ACTN
MCGQGEAHRTLVADGRTTLFGHRTGDAFEAQLSARLGKAGLRIATGPVPFLLATPTETTGAIDPATLIDRLRHWPAPWGNRVREEGGVG